MNFTDAEKTKDVIRQTFSKVQYPGDDKVFAEGVEDSYMEARVGEFRGKHWQDIHSITIRECVDCFIFFTPEALHFYLPAFLIEYLDPKEHEEVVMSLVFLLSPSIVDEKDWGEHDRSKFRLFDAEQRKAVSLYLQCIQEHDPDLFDKEYLTSVIRFWDSNWL
jgi:hypothetical protein